MALPRRETELVDAFVDSFDLAALKAVRPPHALRKLAAVMVCLFITLPIALLLIPWQQNVSGAGRVTAFEPLDRTQIIPAPVTGRLVELNVQEGVFVEKGDVLAEMADQDPQYAMRLEQQFQFVRDKVEAAKRNVEFYDEQLVRLEDTRENAVSSATFELGTALEKVRAEEQALAGAEAEYEQKRADRERKWKLFTGGVASELDFQKAEADSLAARAKVEEAKAKVEQARKEEGSKMAKVEQTRNEYQAKIESTRSDREAARGKVQEAEKELTEAMTKLERQKTQTVVAPRSGTILRVHAASSADLLSQGDPLIELIPDTDELAVELWVQGNDAPLITPGRKVRLQFEGWPAVQFAGWPSVAVGTFGGVVAVVDAQGTAEGRFRALVVPDPEDEPWPEERFLRQGVRTNGWVLLDTVSLGYEIWRQLNAFPPSIRSAPESASSLDGKAEAGGGKKSKKAGGPKE
jgi:multidrug resistance efflux pump